MKVAVACDHRGFDAKKRVIAMIQQAGHEVCDYGCEGTNSVDYPDIGADAARAVGRGQCDVGLLFEGSGIGMAIVANKIRGVRAVHAHDEFTARRSREHHHCNVVSIGADLLSEEQIRSIVDIFLQTELEDGRHTRRIQKITAIENDEAVRDTATP